MKRRYPFKFLFHLIMQLSLFTLSVSGTQAQQDSVHYSAADFQHQKESLRRTFGSGKAIPAQYELAILAALSHFPELASCRIDFVEVPIHATLAVRPRITRLRISEERSYLVYINNNKETTGFTPDQLSFNQQVGAFGHELAHIVYFGQRSAAQLRHDALGFYFRKYRKKIENLTDDISLAAGLGWQLLDFSDFVSKNPNLSRAYARKKKIFYYDSRTIRSKLERGTPKFP